MDVKKLWDRYMNVTSVLDNDEDYVIVSFAGNEVLEWSNIHCDNPEDMLWCRDIGEIAKKFFALGARAAEMEREEINGRKRRN